MTGTADTTLTASETGAGSALDARTLCEAFQITAAENAQRIALRAPAERPS